MSLDRTRDFLDLVSAVPSRRGGPPVAQRATPLAATAADSHRAESRLQSRSAFTTEAQAVSRTLQSTTSKLAVLAKRECVVCHCYRRDLGKRRRSLAVVKKRGMLGDTGAEIDRLTASIRVDMRTLSERLDVLQAGVSDCLSGRLRLVTSPLLGCPPAGVRPAAAFRSGSSRRCSREAAQGSSCRGGGRGCLDSWHW